MLPACRKRSDFSFSSLSARQSSFLSFLTVLFRSLFLSQKLGRLSMRRNGHQSTVRKLMSHLSLQHQHHCSETRILKYLFCFLKQVFGFNIHFGQWAGAQLVVLSSTLTMSQRVIGAKFNLFLTGTYHHANHAMTNSAGSHIPELIRNQNQIFDLILTFRRLQFFLFNLDLVEISRK